MDIEKEFEKFIEEVDEKLKPKIKFKFKSQYAAPKKKGKKVSGSTADQPFAFGISRKAGDRGYGKAGRAPIMMGDDLDEGELTELLKSKDKSVIDAFYNKDNLVGRLLSTNGRSLEKHGMGGQTIGMVKR